MLKVEQDSPFKLSRTYRLASKQDFQSVFASSQKITHKYLLVLYRFNQKDHARLGIVISKHHVQRAVDRNRIRRVCKESFRYYKAIFEKESLKGLDIVVLIRSKCTPLLKGNHIAKAPQLFLRSDIDYIWQRLTTSLKMV